MYPLLRDRTPLHPHLAALSESLDLAHDVVPSTGGYTDHIFFGMEHDIRDAGRSIKRLGFGHVICRLGETERYALVVKHIWTPGELR